MSLKNRKCKSKTQKHWYWAHPVPAPGQCPTRHLQAESWIKYISGPCELVWGMSGMKKHLQLRSVSEKHNLMWRFCLKASGRVGHRFLLLTGKCGLISFHVPLPMCCIWSSLWGISWWLFPQSLPKWFLDCSSTPQTSALLVTWGNKKKIELRT